MASVEMATNQWYGIETAELDSSNWVQVAFRWNNETREYMVIGKIAGSEFSEIYDYDNPKKLAYELYWQKLRELENL